MEASCAGDFPPLAHVFCSFGENGETQTKERDAKRKAKRKRGAFTTPFSVRSAAAMIANP